MEARTSLSDPLRIGELSVGAAGGRIGITFCPGKCGPSLRGRPWARDLGADLDALKAWGAGTVVTLLENHEFDLLQVKPLGNEVRARGMRWLHLPIVDVQPPGALFEREWTQVGPMLADALLAGGAVAVHCRGGLGRAGTVAALLLVAAGVPAAEAIGRVRVVRPRAIETREQEDYVRTWRPNGQASAYPIR